MNRYVALLRGINVGGNKKVPMQQLRTVYTSLGYSSIKTILNSGNIIFDALKKTEGALVSEIEEAQEKKFGFKIPTIVRTISEMQKMIELDPFRGITVTPQTRLYVTFLALPVKTTLKIPFESPEKDFKILSANGRDVMSVLTVTAKYGTTEGMSVLEKEFGKQITTRNWNTVKKIVALADVAGDP